MATHRTNLVLEPDDRRLLQELAGQADRSMSSMVRSLIRSAALERGLLVGAQPSPPTEELHHQ
jgi:hypothetical protein